MLTDRRSTLDVAISFVGGARARARRVAEESARATHTHTPAHTALEDRAAERNIAGPLARCGGDVAVGGESGEGRWKTPAAAKPGPARLAAQPARS